MRVGECIVALVTEVHEGRIVLRHDSLLGQLSVVDLTWDERRPHQCHEYAVVGQSLEVVVLALNDLRFSASVKHLTPDPRASLAVGAQLPGNVHVIREWGSFVAFDNGLVALVEGERDELAVGDRAWFQITVLDRSSNRLVCRRCADPDPA